MFVEGPLKNILLKNLLSWNENIFEKAKFMEGPLENFYKNPFNGRSFGIHF